MIPSSAIRPFLLLALWVSVAATQPSQAQGADPNADSTRAVETDSSELAAERMPLAHRSLLLDVVATDTGFVAVGERGHVLLSADGRRWRQATEVPTRAQLTRVTARGNRLWAVGHDAVIIHSEDGGETWVLQSAEPDLEQPFLDVHFVDDELGFAIGAYGMFRRTEDGGETWEEFFVSEEDDYHLNAIAEDEGGRLFIAAEAGVGYYSDDGGEAWTAIEFPYGGSMFGVLSTGPDQLLAYGLRGNVMYSSDGGENWVARDTGSINSFMGAWQAENGNVLLVGANGEIVLTDATGSRFTSYIDPEGNDFAALARGADGTFVLVGEGGLRIGETSNE